MSASVISRVGKQPDPGAAQSRPQATSEQIRMAHIIQDHKNDDNDKLKSDVRKVIELTNCTEDQALAALHDCDNDVEIAITKLLDGSAGGEEWTVQNTKKSRRQAAQRQQPDDDTENEPSGDQRISKGKPGQNKYPSKPGERPPRFKNDRGPPNKGRGRSDAENSAGANAKRDRRKPRGPSAGKEPVDGGRRPGMPRPRREGGNGMDKIGTWSANGATSAKESNTWDNSMAKDEQSSSWTGTNGQAHSNMWDNSMAEHITRRSGGGPEGAPQPNLTGVREDWNNSSTDDFDWTTNQKTLVFNNSNVAQKSPSPSQAVAAITSPPTDTGPAGRFRAGDNVDVKVLMNQAPPPGNSGPYPPMGMNSGEQIAANEGSPSWNQQATNNLKNELGIGREGVAPTTSQGGSGDRSKTTKVEMPFDVGVNVGSMDIQFGFRESDGSGNSMDYSLPPGLYSQRTPNKLENGSTGPAGILGLKEAPKVSAAGMPQTYSGNGGRGRFEEPTASPPSLPEDHAAPIISSPLAPHKTQGRPNANQTANTPGSSLANSYGVSSEVGDSLQSAVPLHSSMGMSVGSSQSGPSMSAQYGVGTFGGNNGANVSNAGGMSNNKGGVPNQTGKGANIYGAPMYGVGVSPLPYMNMYSPVATGPTGVRPEDSTFLQQMQMGVPFMNTINTFDMSTMTGVPPMVSSVPSTRDSSNISFTHSDMKSMGGSRSDTTSVSAGGAMPGPPPGFSVATVSNASAASQLISHTQYGAFAPPMFPTIPPNYQSLGPQVPQLLHMNHMGLGSSSSGGGPAQFPKTGGQPPNFYQSPYDGDVSQDYVRASGYGNTNSQVGKYQGGGNMTGADKNFAGAGNLNKSNYVEAKFATGTPPPLSGLPQFPPNFAGPGYGANYGMPMLSPLIPANPVMEQRGGGNGGKPQGAGKGYGAPGGYWGAGLN